jgi:hypothetical protein
LGWAVLREGGGGGLTSDGRIAFLGRAARARDGRAERERRTERRTRMGVASRRILSCRLPVEGWIVMEFMCSVLLGESNRIFGLIGLRSVAEHLDGWWEGKPFK